MGLSQELVNSVSGHSEVENTPITLIKLNSHWLLVPPEEIPA